MRYVQGAKTRLAVFYDAATGPVGYRIAAEIAERAWDAGATVRVLRLCDAATPVDHNPASDWTPVLDEVTELSEASVTDLEWANVMFVVSTPR